MNNSQLEEKSPEDKDFNISEISEDKKADFFFIYSVGKSSKDKEEDFIPLITSSESEWDTR